MQSLTNQKSNRIASRVTTWLIVLALAVGCRERATVDSVTSPTGSYLPTTPSQTESFDADLDLLFERLCDRLNLMPDVARYKWAHDLPIEVPERERLLIDRFVDDARTHGLEADWSRRVIVAQITAARRVQENSFKRWKSSPPDESEQILDLQTNLRPRIEQLTADLIEILVRLEPHRQTAEFLAAFSSRTDSLTTHDAVSDEVQHLAIAPWLERESRTDSER